MAAAIATVLMWQPWDRDELHEAAGDIARVPGVAAVDLEYREIEGAAAAKVRPEPSKVDVMVRLESTLAPDAAAVAAERAHELLIPAAEAVTHDNVSVHLHVTAGEPEKAPGIRIDPLEVPYSPISGAADVADAFTIWQAGPRSVQVYGLAPAVGEATADSGSGNAPDSRAGIGIEAGAAADMVPLAELAAGLGRTADLHFGDDAYYAGHGAVADVDAVRLTVAAASRRGVESAFFSNYSTAPQLSVRAAWPAESPETPELKRWLEAHDYAASAGRPVAFTISEPGYETLTEGWVSAFAPPEPEPHPLPLPAGVEAWPDDVDAPSCTGADLDVGYGGSDAATGARYALLLARNVSDRPCAVEGIPGIALRNADGAEQTDIRLEPYTSSAVPARLVVPPGEQLLAPLQWRAMSTANDPDVTTSVEVTAVPGAEPVLLDVTDGDGPSAGLDILDGAELRLGPWVQALEGWS
ncbi:DUF4232 domain-containing protein [Phytoactinopolyspora mesophila]|nr:DUF4232 domain-containing protein [Phytoactinopolyspora mesophila]